MKEFVMQETEEMTTFGSVWKRYEPVAELVRCKDCKHRDPEDRKCDCGHDIQWQLPRPDDWFCADGKRKEGK